MRRIATKALHVAILLALVHCLVGCHGIYNLVVENHRSDPVEVSFLEDTWVMRPCSLRSWPTAGPPAGSKLVLTAKDATGQVVYSTTIRSRYGDAPDFRVMIPAAGNDTCPAPAQTFYLKVTNFSPEVVSYYQSGQLVGTAEPKADTRVGPFLGAWPDLNGVTFRKGNGEEKLLHSYGVGVNYDLGSVPELGTTVNEWEWCPTMQRYLSSMSTMPGTNPDGPRPQPTMFGPCLQAIPVRH